MTPVQYAKLETPAPLLDQTGVYLPYRPSRIIFDKAGEHPTALVESVTMGSIPAPIPNYVPRLPERTVAERLLSASQLETVVYAGHAWSQTIPDRFKPNKEGVRLTLAEDGDAYRKGFFLGEARLPALSERMECHYTVPTPRLLRLCSLWEGVGRCIKVKAKVWQDMPYGTNVGHLLMMFRCSGLLK